MTLRFGGLAPAFLVFISLVGCEAGSGAIIRDGTLFVNSGYGVYFHMPGNVLLAFAVRSDEVGH